MPVAGFTRISLAVIASHKQRCSVPWMFLTVFGDSCFSLYSFVQNFWMSDCSMLCIGDESHRGIGNRARCIFVLWSNDRGFPLDSVEKQQHHRISPAIGYYYEKFKRSSS